VFDQVSKTPAEVMQEIKAEVIEHQEVGLWGASAPLVFYVSSFYL
jgi:hypothetical protein